MKDVYLVANARTPFGKFNGALKSYSPLDLASFALKGMLSKINLDPTEIEGLFLGNVLSSGVGQNLARQVALKAGMREKSLATTINEVCGSSLKAVRLAQAQMIIGDLDLVAVGGVESMSRAPFLIPRHEVKADNPTYRDSLQVDGLEDAFSHQAMGMTAENVAETFKISRREQDEFSFFSHDKAYSAVKNGWFSDEILPIKTPNGILQHDEPIRSDTSLEVLSRLKPVFKPDGTVTAGNASPLSDGAAMLLLATQEKVDSLGLTPIAHLGDYAEVGIDPDIMGYGPVAAIQKLLTQTHSKITDFDAIEINEAFASSVLAVAQALKLDTHKLNPAGGAIALGHPLGATGARLIGAAMNDLIQYNGSRALVSLCIGGGLAIAFEIRRLR